MTENKSQTTKEYVKELTDYMKDDKECVVPLSVLKKANGVVDIFIEGYNKESDSKHAGLRYNQGKLRYDLICPEQLKGLASVYTYGATKYKPHNWSKGQAYSTILASLKRHIAAFEAGEDYDAESKCQHMAHAMWNCGALISFAKKMTKPQEYQGRKYRLDAADIIEKAKWLEYRSWEWLTTWKRFTLEQITFEAI